jgi:LCP family protein required for cell wall assembly
MKKPIDPNLNNLDNDDILLSLSESKNTKKPGELEFAEGAEPDSPKAEPNYHVQNKDEISSAGEHHHSSSGEHHHSSSGEHHHSSSGEHHHSSSGEHHHSSSGERHHSSSGERHHSSSGEHHHSSSSSHHSKQKKKLPLAARIAIGVVVVILVIVLALVLTFFILQAKGHEDVMPTVTEDVSYEETIEYNGHTYEYNEDVFAVAFLGIDQRDLETSDETDFVGAADADIVVAVDTKTGKSNVIAIPRDTMVDIDMWSESGIFLRTQEAQLCLAYSYGDGAEKSCQNSINAISRILYNVPIEKYFALDLDGIAPLNDAIGGVTIDSSLYEFEDMGISIGDTVTLKGDMAESYVRTRDMDYLEASLNRTDRQVQYVKAYAQQLVPAVMKNFSVVSTLYSTASSYSQTNLTLSNATYIASLMLSKGVTNFDTYTLTGTMTSSDDEYFEDVVHAEFTPDEDSLMQAVLAAFYTQID